MDTALKVMDYVVDYINAVPASSWVALGTLLAGSAIVTGIVAWINRRRLKKDVEKLGKAMVTFIILFLSAVVSVADFVINNGVTFGAFLPYWATHVTQVIAISTIIYNFAKPSLAWWKARKAGTPIENPNMPALSEQLQTASTTLYGQNAYGTVTARPSGSMGTEATGNVAPPKDLFGN